MTSLQFANSIDVSGHPSLDAIEPRSLYVIDSEADRVNKIRMALGRSYMVSPFTNGRAALDAMRKSNPDAVLVDEHTLRTQGGGVHRSKCTDNSLKHIPFIIMSDTQSGPFVAGDGSGAADHFLKRPIRIEQLINRLDACVGQRVERSWKALPKPIATALQTTLVQFDDIAKAIANNTPLDRKAVTAGCNPLVACVQDDQHKLILKALRDHSNYTYVHSMRVAVFMAVFAKAYNVSKDEMTQLAIGGFLHDVGKIALSQELVNKTGNLDESESSALREHAQQSQHIVQSIEGIHDAVRVIVEQHHERLDGSGYPNQLQGTQINELGRMSAIADTFATLTDIRPLKRAFAPSVAFAILEQQPFALDQRLVKLFRAALED